LIVRLSIRGGVRRPSSKRAGKSPLHPSLHPSGCFSVLHGGIRQHETKDCR
jgi:hypothetical protein